MNEFNKNLPRLKAKLQIDALCRRARAEGSFATILRKGDPASGKIWILSRKTDSNRLYFLEPELETGRLHWRFHDDELCALEKRIDNEVQIDPDIWLIEIEDRLGRIFSDLEIAK